MNKDIASHSIHIYADSQDIFNLMEDLSDDHRLGNAKIMTRLGGIGVCVPLYKDITTPNILIIHSKLQKNQFMEALAQLAGNCNSETLVFLILDIVNDSLKQELLALGIRDVFFEPLNIEELISSLLTIVPEAKDINIAQGPICFLPTRPGAGASMIAHNIAWHVGTTLDETSILADYDIKMGTAGLNFFRDPIETVETALIEATKGQILGRTLRGYAADIEDRLSLLASPSNMLYKMEESPAAFDAITHGLIEEYDNVFLDLPSSWSPFVQSNILIAEQLILVATPDLAALRNAKNILSFINRSHQKPSLVHLVLNKMGEPKRKSIREQDFEDSLEMPISAIIPYEPAEVSRMEINGEVAIAQESNSVFCKKLRAFGDHVAERRVLRFEKPEDIARKKEAVKTKSKKNNSSLFSTGFFKKIANKK